MNNTEKPKKKKSGLRTFLIIAAIIGVFGVIVDAASSSEEDTTYYEEPAYVQEDEPTEQITTTTATTTTATTTTTTAPTTTTAASISDNTEPVSSNETTDMFVNSPNAIYNSENGFTVEYEISFQELVERYCSIVEGESENESVAAVSLMNDPTVNDFQIDDTYSQLGIDTYYFNYTAVSSGVYMDRLLAQINIYVCRESGNVIGIAYHHRNSDNYFNNNYEHYGLEIPGYWFAALTGRNVKNARDFCRALAIECQIEPMSGVLPINRETDGNWAREGVLYAQADTGIVLDWHFYVGGETFFSIL